MPPPIVESAVRNLEPYVEAHEDRWAEKGLDKKAVCALLNAYWGIFDKFEAINSGEKEKFLEE